MPVNFNHLIESPILPDDIVNRVLQIATTGVCQSYVDRPDGTGRGGGTGSPVHETTESDYGPGVQNIEGDGHGFGEGSGSSFSSSARGQYLSGDFGHGSAPGVGDAHGCDFEPIRDWGLEF